MRSDEQKKSARNCNCGKNEMAKHWWKADHNFSWDQKKVIGRESRLIPRKIKETIYSLKNPNHHNKISIYGSSYLLIYVILSGFIQRPLDYFFISNSLQESNMKTTDPLATFSTDHSPIALSVCHLKEFLRGKGLWKFKNLH